MTTLRLHRPRTLRAPHQFSTTSVDANGAPGYIVGTFVRLGVIS